MAKQDIDHECTDNIVCPHCGAAFEDDGHYFPYNSDTLKDDCYECGKPFQAHREFSVYYTTEPLTEGGA